MTITYIGIGATVTGNNASLAPTFPPSPVNGDLLMLTASIRNSGAGSPNTPTDWVVMLDMGNAKVFGRYMDTGVTAPTVTFSGGVANADTQAAIIGFRGVAPNQLSAFTSSGAQTNASAQNIAYPALNVPGKGYAVVLAAWKQDDATSIAMPGGFTGAINSFVTTGDDATLRVGYSIQTSEADIAASSLTVVGGAAAISKAGLIALMPLSVFAVTTQELVYPPRAVLAVSSLLGDEVINLYRSVAGVRTLVRGGEITNTDDLDAYVRIDAELPFEVPITWIAEVNGAEYTSQSETLTLPGGKVVLSDAISGLAAEAVILSWPERTYERRVSVFRLANGETKTVSGNPARFTGRIDLFTLTDTTRELVKDLLDNAIANVIQIRQPGGYSDVDCYVSVLSFSVRRYSQDGTDQRRIFSLEVAEVFGWSAAFEAAGYTYADLDEVYTGLTYASLDADYATYLALAVAELEP